MQDEESSPQATPPRGTPQQVKSQQDTLRRPATLTRRGLVPSPPVPPSYRRASCRDGAACPFVEVTVTLTGQDGNAFSILARVRRALIDAGEQELAVQFLAEATAGDYDNLLMTCMIYVHVT